MDGWTHYNHYLKWAGHLQYVTNHPPLPAVHPPLRQGNRTSHTKLRRKLQETVLVCLVLDMGLCGCMCRVCLCLLALPLLLICSVCIPEVERNLSAITALLDCSKNSLINIDPNLVLLGITTFWALMYPFLYFRSWVCEKPDMRT